MAEAVGEAATLEFTPTWIVAAVCSLIVLISLLAERCLHYLGKTFKRKNQKPLYEAILKVKEELMLLGFISLLLTVFQGMIQKTCISPGWALHMLPCTREELAGEAGPTEEHFVTTAQIIGRIGRRLLSEDGVGAEICQQKGKVPLMSLEAIHQLHIFIFVLAITHVVFSVLTMLLGGAKIHQWKQWEEAIQKDTAGNGPKKVTGVLNFEFIRDHFKGIGKDSRLLSWLQSFFKQFYGSVGKSDYRTMRLGFIMTHCRGNQKFDFHKYMLRVLESDFKKVVGISWYLWVFVVIFLLLNVNGWHTYFWIAFIPLLRPGFSPLSKKKTSRLDITFSASLSHYDYTRCYHMDLFTLIFASYYLASCRNINHTMTVCNKYDGLTLLYLQLLLAVGTKLEHVIAQLAQDVAEKHSAIEGDLIVKPSDDHFWFGRPRIVLFLIHFILFQNAFEIAFFFWILTTYGFNSCIMGQVGFIVPRLVIGLIIQLLCSYSTLPLYAIVTQMGSSYKKEIFNEHVQQGVLGWAQKVKMKKEFKTSNTAAGSTSTAESAGPSAKIEMMKRAAREGNDAGESIE